MAQLLCPHCGSLVTKFKRVYRVEWPRMPDDTIRTIYRTRYKNSYLAEQFGTTVHHVRAIKTCLSVEAAVHKYGRPSV